MMNTNFYAHTVATVIKVGDKELQRTMYVKMSQLQPKQGETKKFYEFHGDFYKNGQKIGFYRYDTHYQWPTFFAKVGMKMKHTTDAVTGVSRAEYLANAITEAIKEGCRIWWKECVAASKQAALAQQAGAVVEETAAPEVPVQEKQSIEDFMFSVGIDDWTEEVFVRLGTTKKIATALVAAVKDGSAKTFEDFQNVKGVGPKTYEKLVSEFMTIAKDHAA